MYYFSGLTCSDLNVTEKAGKVDDRTWNIPLLFPQVINALLRRSDWPSLALTRLLEVGLEELAYSTAYRALAAIDHLE